MRTRNKPHTVESLMALAERAGDCIVWRGTARSNGYGVTVYMGKQTTTHRIMYQLHTGNPVPADMEVDHTCNTRLCINPEHLQMVSHVENMKLGAQRRLTCRAGHDWNDDNTYIAVVKRKQGGTREQRYCRVCRAIAQQNFRDRIQS